MGFWPSLILGIVQGLTEFLPVSSSAHLIVVPWLFGWADPGLAFDVGLHWGTLAAVTAYFWKDLLSLALGALRFLKGDRTSSEGRLALFLVLGSVPAAAAGFLLRHAAESTLRNPVLIVCTLSGMGLVLWAAERFFHHEKDLNSMDAKNAFGIGCAQALALVPGVSRSGATISAALALGLSRAEAARFSFLLSVPVTFGAGLLEIPHMKALANTQSFWIGCISAAVSGYAAIGFLLRYVQTKSYAPFVVYRFLLAAAILLTLLWRTS